MSMNVIRNSAESVILGEWVIVTIYAPEDKQVPVINVYGPYTKAKAQRISHELAQESLETGHTVARYIRREKKFNSD